jgi:hypothetical protein
MTNANPELPAFFRQGAGIYDLAADDRPGTWTLWDQNGCIGEILLDESTWAWRLDATSTVSDAFPTWEEALTGLLAAPRS